MAKKARRKDRLARRLRGLLRPFYEALMLEAERLNGINQQQYLVPSPTFLSRYSIRQHSGRPREQRSLPLPD